MNVLAKLKNSKVAKWLTVASVSAMMFIMSALTCFAAEGDDGTTAALTSAFGSIKNDIFSYILIVLPVALAVFGLFFGIKKAIAFFRSAAGK